MKYGFSKKVEYGFEEAIKKVTAELKEEGFGVLTEIDVKTTLKNKLNVDFPKYKILGACNPPLAYQALSNELEIGLLLPCNVIVYDNNDNTSTVAAIDAQAMFSVIDRNDFEKVAKTVNEKLQRVMNNL